MSAPSIPSGMNLTESRAPNIIASVTVLWVTAIVAVALRFTARRKAHLQLGWDDWLVLFALVFPFSGTCIANYVGITLGSGQHLVYVLETQPESAEGFLKYVYAVELLYPWILGPLKCSVLLLYVRLFHIDKTFRYYCYCLMVLCICWAIALELGSAFQCTPVSEAWNPRSDRSMCVDLRHFLVAFNVPNIVLNSLILTAPIRMIWRLSLSLKRKVFISGILMLGVGETIFSIVRLTTLTNLDTSDATWNYFGAIIWSTVEQSVGILCVCLPVMGPLMPSRLVGSSAHTTGGSSSSGYQKHGTKYTSTVSQGAVYDMQRRFGNGQAAPSGHNGYGDHSFLTQASSEREIGISSEELGISKTTDFTIEHSQS